LRKLVHGRQIGTRLDSVGPDPPCQIHEDERQSVDHALLRNLADLLVAWWGLGFGRCCREQEKREETKTERKSFRRVFEAQYYKPRAHTRQIASSPNETSSEMASAVTCD
jgi:hypothetical protein